MFGAFTLLTYFVPLGFLPDFDFSDITGLLFVAACLGALQLLIISATLLLPALLGLPAATALLSRKNKEQRTKWLVIASLAGPCFWVVALRQHVVEGQVWIAMGLVMLIVVAALLYVLTKSLRAGWAALILGAQGAQSFFAAILVQPAPESSLLELNDHLQWVLLAVWCALVWIANVAVTKDGRRNLGAVLGVSAYLLFCLIFLTQNLAYFHGMAIRFVGLGDVRNVTITTTDAGAAVLRSACRGTSAPASCKVESISVGTMSGHAYSGLTILSRVGRQHYLQLCGPKDRAGPCGKVGGLRVVLDKKEVLGWSQVGTKERKSRPQL